MNRFYVVAIHPSRFHVSSKYRRLETLTAVSLAEACKRPFNFKVPQLVSLVLRSGSTGKRYSLEECTALKGGAA